MQITQLNPFPANRKERWSVIIHYIVERIQAKTGFKKPDSIELVEALFELLKGTLESGENVKVSGFGNFEVKEKVARIGRNPQTGEELTIEARRILTFKPSAFSNKPLIQNPKQTQ